VEIRVAFSGPLSNIFWLHECVTKHSKVCLVMTMYIQTFELSSILPLLVDWVTVRPLPTSGHNYNWKAIPLSGPWQCICIGNSGRTYNPHGIVYDLFRPRPSLTYHLLVFFMISIFSSFRDAES
jgi:hypothetical protein